jgi:hypothetical protein
MLPTPEHLSAYCKTWLDCANEKTSVNLTISAENIFAHFLVHRRQTPHLLSKPSYLELSLKRSAHTRTPRHPVQAHGSYKRLLQTTSYCNQCCTSNTVTNRIPRPSGQVSGHPGNARPMVIPQVQTRMRTFKRRKRPGRAGIADRSHEEAGGTGRCSPTSWLTMPVTVMHL